MKLFRSRLRPALYLCLSAIVALPALLALPQHAAPQTPASTLTFNVDPAQSTVHWTLGSSLHTVHGTFALRSGNLRLDPGTSKAEGEIVVDSASGQSGNDGRDKKMHKEVLESAKFSEIVFRPDSVTGNLATQGESSVQLHGRFVLHGAEHELTVPMQANLSGDHWTASAKFSVPYVEWGLKNPSTWLLKADRTVTIELELKGTLQPSGAQ